MALKVTTQSNRIEVDLSNAQEGDRIVFTFEDRTRVSMRVRITPSHDAVLKLDGTPTCAGDLYTALTYYILNHGRHTSANLKKFYKENRYPLTKSNLFWLLVDNTRFRNEGDNTMSFAVGSPLRFDIINPFPDEALRPWFDQGTGIYVRRVRWATPSGLKTAKAIGAEKVRARKEAVQAKKLRRSD